MRRGQRQRLPNTVVGVIAVAIVAIASWLAFTKELPWGEAYEVKAVFPTAMNIRVDSPVRIAGVDVGKVVEVEQLTSGDEATLAQADGDAAALPEGTEGEGQQAAVVTMRIEDVGRPVKEDATFQLNPRLFLEGNLYVRLRPGTPGAPEAEDGYVFPLDQTYVSVQLDQILTTLQSDVREDLQILLEEFGAALVDHGGAEGFQELYRTSPGAYRFTAEVNEAFLGEEPHDLSGFIKHLDQVERGLARNEEQLKDLVTNFRIFAGSFAAEDQALERAIVELPEVLDAADPAFRELNAAFPSLRAFAREALPGTRSTPETLDASIPFIHQLRRLASKRELRGLTADLRPTIPRLAKLTRKTIPFLEESRALSSCFNEVVIPWSNDEVNGGAAYPHPAVGPVFKETGYGLVGIAGESRSGDANAQYIRVGAGGGANSVAFQPPGEADEFFGVTPFPILGSMPAISSSAKTPFRPGSPCEKQEQPDLRSTVGPAPEQSTVSTSALRSSPSAELGEDFKRMLERLAEEHEGVSAGKAQRLFQREYERFTSTDFRDYKREIGALGGGE